MNSTERSVTSQFVVETYTSENKRKLKAKHK